MFDLNLGPRRLILSGIICSIFVCSSISADESSRFSALTLEALIKNIIKVYEDYASELSLDVDQRRFGKYEMAMEEARELAKELGSRGDAAFPEIKGSVLDITLSAQARRMLLTALKDIPTRQVEEFLLEIALNDSQLYDVAFSLLKQRSVQRNGLEIRLSEKQLAYFEQEILVGTEKPVWLMCKYLNIFKETPLRERVKPVIERYYHEVMNNTPVREHPDFNVGSYREYILCGFLDVFKDFGADIQPFLRLVMDKNLDNKELQKWFALALASTGDSSVGDAVARVVDNTSNSPDVRAHAVKSYVAAIGDAAIPNLERWSVDSAKVIEKMHEMERFPVAAAARLELSSIKR